MVLSVYTLEKKFVLKNQYRELHSHIMAQVYIVIVFARIFFWWSLCSQKKNVGQYGKCYCKHVITTQWYLPVVRILVSVCV